MRHYHNPLYVSHGTADETEGLKQALSLARNNDAPLGVLVVCPEFPGEFPDYRKKYEESLLAQAKSSIRSTKEAIKLDEGAVDISIALVSDKNPSTKIIQCVLQQGHDLLIKEAEPRDGSGSGSGFKAIDMDLLRKCPCAVWLCRPIAHSRQHIQVAVAIDPESSEAAAEALSKRMLELSHSLADSCSGELHIISAPSRSGNPQGERGYPDPAAILRCGRTGCGADQSTAGQGRTCLETWRRMRFSTQPECRQPNDVCVWSKVASR